MGTPTERLQGLLAGTVDAAEASYPIDAQGEKKGYRILLDLRKEVSYPSMSVVTRRKTIAEDRETVARMVRAHVEGIADFEQNKEFSLRVLGKALKITDREMLENSYETYKQDFIATPYPITKGLEATYDFIARQTRPEYATGSQKSSSIRVSLPIWRRAGLSRSFTRRSRQQASGSGHKIDSEESRGQSNCKDSVVHCDCVRTAGVVGVQNPPLRTSDSGMTALSAAMWIPWIAKDAKIYEKNGLDVDIVLPRGSGQSSQRCWAAVCSPRRWRCRR